jgi:hypothetical protein
VSCSGTIWIPVHDPDLGLTLEMNGEWDLGQIRPTADLLEFAAADERPAAGETTALCSI